MERQLRSKLDPTKAAETHDLRGRIVGDHLKIRRFLGRPELKRELRDESKRKVSFSQLFGQKATEGETHRIADNEE